MVKRKGKYGDFWGCLGYPKCTNTLTQREADRELAMEIGEQAQFDSYDESNDFDEEPH